jgi:MarR family 2-MHQ and catechol resistance regulon transcriptional repressor
METGSHIRLVLGRAAKAIERIERAGIAGMGLHFSDFMILEALLHKGPLPINTIAEKVLLTSGSMTAAANRLVRRDLVQRIRDASDGRCFHLHLTASGRRLIEKTYEVHAAQLERIAAVLSDAERSDLVRLLKKIGRHAQGMALDQRKDRKSTATRRQPQ